MDYSLLYCLPFLMGHVGLSGRGLIKIGHLQYILHKLYAILEPTILKIVDFILSIKLLTDTTTGRMILQGIARASWLFPHGIVVTTESAGKLLEFITKDKSSNRAQIAIGPCVCQRGLNRWKEPSCKDIVILYGADIYTHLKLGYKVITLDEAKKFLRDFSTAGLIHEVDFCMQSGKWTFVICNCDKEICVPTRVHLLAGHLLYPGPEIVNQMPELCIGVDKCGHCTERCLFGAFIIKNNKVAVDYKKCMGCGLCVQSCTAKTRTMKLRNDYRYQNKISTKIFLGK